MTPTIVTYDLSVSNPLNRETNLVEIWDDVLNDAAKNMIMLLAEDPNAAAIAANQIGVPYCFFVYANKEGIAEIVINPEIIYGDTPVFLQEGCLSFPGMQALIQRYNVVEVNYTSYPSMKEVTERLEGFEAQVFQHEIDHLDGMTILDRMGKDQRHEFLGRFRKSARNSRPTASATRRTGAR